MPDSSSARPETARRALPIETFDNRSGGDALFRAVGHPLAVDGGFMARYGGDWPLQRFSNRSGLAG
jgi:hypothetical protein